MTPDTAAPMSLREYSPVTPDTAAPVSLRWHSSVAADAAAPASLPEQVWLRFVEGRPISPITTQYLAWCCDKLEALGKTALLMIWDNASWHLSKAVRTWIHTHNRQIKQQGRGVRIVACYLPSKSPWLNRIEPHWVHGKRNIVEPARLLVADRVCAYFGCEHEPHLVVTENIV